MIEEPPKLPLVSVLIPAFNHAAFLNACLDSVIADGYPNIEIVIIDDGSTDESGRIIARWLQGNAHALRHVVFERQENVGLLKTLNRLIRKSSGEYLVMLASDDMLLEGGIRARLDAFQRNPRWMAVFGDTTIINELGETTHRSGLEFLHRANKRALADPRTITLELILRWSVPGPVLMVRRDIYFNEDGIGLYPEDLLVEDRHFYLAVLARSALGFVDFPVAGYRLHSNQTINSTNPKLFLDVLNTERHFIDHFSGIPKFSLIMLSSVKSSFPVNEFIRPGLTFAKQALLLTAFVLLLFNYTQTWRRTTS